MSKLILAVLICLMTVSCAKTRETAKAVANADVAAVAITKLATSKDVANAVSSMSEAEKKIMADFINKVIKLSQTVDYSLKPAIVELSQGENIQPSATVDEAIEQVDSFVTKSMIQAGKATAEVEQNEANRSFIGGLVDIGTSLLEGNATIAGILTGTGGFGLIVAGLLKQLSKYKTAMIDQVKYAKTAKSVPPDISEEEWKKIQDEHISNQKRNGTHDIIAHAVQKARAQT